MTTPARVTLATQIKYDNTLCIKYLYFFINKYSTIPQIINCTILIRCQHIILWPLHLLLPQLRVAAGAAEVWAEEQEAADGGH